MPTDVGCRVASVGVVMSTDQIQSSCTGENVRPWQQLKSCSQEVACKVHVTMWNPGLFTNMCPVGLADKEQAGQKHGNLCPQDPSAIEQLAFAVSAAARRLGTSARGPNFRNLGPNLTCGKSFQPRIIDGSIRKLVGRGVLVGSALLKLTPLFVAAATPAPTFFKSSGPAAAT